MKNNKSLPLGGKKFYGFMYRGNGYGWWKTKKTAIKYGIVKSLTDTSEFAHRGFGLFESDDGKTCGWPLGMYRF
jgi:hypothetical protein